ncbi:hypothetical protein [Paenibacillus marinisediminis]
MENWEKPDPSSLSPVFISKHYSVYNKVVIQKDGSKIGGIIELYQEFIHDEQKQHN